MSPPGWLSARLRPPAENTGPQGRDPAPEALRGICALLVFYAHGFIPGPGVDPVYAPSDKFGWFNLGQAGVLMFFMLSGYVIGLTTRQPLTRQTAGRYLSRRAGRLLPVTYAAIFLAWLFLPTTSLHTLWGNALFLQNSDAYPVAGWVFPLLENNGALWTLNYEALYYLLFMVIWWRSPSFLIVLGLVVILSMGRGAGLPFSVVITRYACGAWYWLAGLSIAWLTDAVATGPQRRTRWPSALLAAHALWILAPLRQFLSDRFAFSWLDITVASVHRLDFLPVGLWCMLAVTGRAPKAERWLALICLAWGWIGFVHALWETHSGADYLAGLTLFASSALMAWRPSLSALEKLAPLGAISFGLYALASPLQIAQKNLLPGFSGTALTFSVRLILLLLVTAALAWLLDYRLNRWISARLRK